VSSALDKKEEEGKAGRGGAWGSSVRGRKTPLSSH